jgi:hypothetical protein
VVGGLHLPVHAAGTSLVPQAILGNPHPPWQPIGERDAEHVMKEIQARGPRQVALSGHDSTPWTYDAFTRAFGERYRTLRAGEALRITATAPEPGGAGSCVAPRAGTGLLTAPMCSPKSRCKSQAWSSATRPRRTGLPRGDVDRGADHQPQPVLARPVRAAGVLLEVV